jgi:hypothetical protein
MANPVGGKRPLDLINPSFPENEKKQKIDHSLVPNIPMTAPSPWEPLSAERVSVIDGVSDDVSFEGSEDTSLPFIELEKKYASLFKTDFIEFTDVIQVGVIHHVDMDEFAVVDGDKVLGTQGVNACFAVCAKGSTAQGQIKLGLCHFSSLQPVEYIINLVKEKLQEAGCTGKNEIYVIGGTLPVAENLDEFPGTLEMEQHILENASTYGISGVQLHLTRGEFALDVVFTAEKIFCGYDIYSEETLNVGQEIADSEEGSISAEK